MTDAAAAAATTGPAEPTTGPVELDPVSVKPRMRGWLHAGMFPAVLIAGITLIALADSTRGRIACAVYIATACLLFGVSAVYHRGTWGPRGEAVLRRLDHANIFLIIAGTYTPLTLLLLPESTGRPLLWAVGGRRGGHRVPGLLGRRAALAVHAVLHRDGLGRGFLPAGLHADGRYRGPGPGDRRRLYSAGGVIYGIKRPNPSPRWFGFHEVFHSLTLAAFVAHYVGISLVAYQHG
ncbi:Hemolysin III family protein OS=Streptomyces microflavus OX=1919 GN=G3I39_03050 PE=4 SV=1 [Streptomyces microflavus]